MDLSRGVFIIRTLASTVFMYTGYFSWTLDTTGVP